MSIKKADELISEFSRRGLYFNRDLLFNYYLSIITKPFVILTGISGSGKSKIAEVFAEIISEDGKKNYELVPVKPNWRDSKGIFGYHNLINGGYYTTPTIELFLRAFSDPEHPYFLILDEMNIAKAEHYFADYLSLIESRRIVEIKKDDSAESLGEIFSYDTIDKLSLSEAIILSAIDLKATDKSNKVETYRKNRFSELWRITFSKGGNWTAQFRSELNQGENRLAHRIFERTSDGVYRYKRKSELSSEDAETVTRLEMLYESIFEDRIVQDNMILHNAEKCIDSNGKSCDCSDCPYSQNEKYKCEKLYNGETGQYLVPPEMPIPLNVFTIGTVNVDETTYMFSPKVLDRSNVIEFNEVDFCNLYDLTPAQTDLITSVSKNIINADFFFDAGQDMPGVKLSIPNKNHVKDFSLNAKDEFNVLINVFSILKKYNMHFGYRVMNEISCYMYNLFRFTTEPGNIQTAFDNQLLQKILPKIYGSYDKIWKPLVEILGALLNTTTDMTDIDSAALIDLLNELVGSDIKSLELNGTQIQKCSPYPKSALKILDMLSDLDTAGFATFIK